MIQASFLVVHWDLFLQVCYTVQKFSLQFYTLCSTCTLSSYLAGNWYKEGFSRQRSRPYGDNSKAPKRTFIIRAKRLNCHCRPSACCASRLITFMACREQITKTTQLSLTHRHNAFEWQPKKCSLYSVNHDNVPQVSFLIIQYHRVTVIKQTRFTALRDLQH